MEQSGKKRSLFIQIYDELYGAITTGVYKEGTMLPSEAALMEMYKVSRVTVRQALSLLQEDGIVRSIQGKGTIVCGIPLQLPGGLETNSNPVYSCYRTPPDNLQMISRVGLVTGYLKKRFLDRSLAALTVERTYTKEEKVMVYGLSYIPVEAAEALQLDLTDESAVRNFLEKEAYEKAKYISVSMKMTDTIDFVINRPKDKLKGKVLLYKEDMYFEEDYPYVHSKYYFVSTDYKIHFNARKLEKEEGGTGKW